MLGTVREGKEQLPVRLDLYALHQAAPAIFGEFRLFAQNFQHTLKRKPDLLFVKKRRLADLAVSVPLIAVPDIVSLGIAMIVPYLVAIEAATVGADELINGLLSLSLAR